MIADQKNETLFERLAEEGLHAKPEQPSSYAGIQSFGMDSMAAMSYILRLGLNPGCQEINVSSLIDTAENPALLKGEDGIFTSGLIPKPSYFAYKMLQHMNGELIHWGKYHAVVRKKRDDSTQSSYCLVCYNHNEETENLCKRQSSIEETLDRIDRFTASLDIGIHLNGIFGKYQIVIYRLSQADSLLNFAMKNGISRTCGEEVNRILSWSASPKVDISTETLTGTMFFHISLNGLEAQCILITPLQSDDDYERQ